MESNSSFSGNKGPDDTETLTPEDEEAAAQNAARQRRGSFNPLDYRVLIVDDEATTLAIARKLFQRLGYSYVKTVSNGQAALEELQNGRFNLLMSDIHMPRMNGFELLQETRKVDRDIPVFMMSSTEDLDLVYRCLKQGADHYVLKPLKEEQLKGIWQTLYKQRQEKKVLLELELQRSKAIRLEKVVAGLQEDVAQAIDVPLQLLTRQLEAMLNTSSLPAEVILSTLLKQLSRVELYQPAFNKLLAANELNPNTRQWLMTELDPANTYERLYQPEAGVGRELSEIHTQGWPKLDEIHEHNQLRSWDFDVWQYSEEKLLPMIVDMFNDFGLIEKFKIPEDKLHNFLMAVRNNYYRRNPYHCFRHAFDVTQTVYQLLTTVNAAEYLNYLEILALFVAAVVHDLGHPGVGNSFHYATVSSLALTYNDRSILENFHCARAFQLLEDPENDIFEGLTREQRRDVRSHIITAVLATDLAHHHAIMARFTTKLVTKGEWTKEDKECRTLLLEMLLKCADISNPGKPFESAQYWAKMVQEEFFFQGDMELAKGMPVSPFMDRTTPQLPRMQLNFIEYLVIPLFDSVKKILPKIEPFCNVLTDNRAGETLESD
eukprot:TRINITY_DN716_c0_g2_i3.p1 TRINITY_DN716_c0_g2~~TRINITY_DN716_c0_g2_i3.p1  ORF type:complete len:604 (-),score=126.73 TRINITY_DN716_c0_g2_i3:81-1892(-)